MKRLITCLLCAFLVGCVFSVPAGAEQVSTIVEQFEDGSYIEEYIIEDIARSSDTKTVTKYQNYRDENGNIDWTITLTATFTYDGTTAKSTSAESSVSIYVSYWSMVNKYTVRSGNTATGKVTLSQTALGIEVARNTYTIELTCTPDGTVS